MDNLSAIAITAAKPSRTPAPNKETTPPTDNFDAQLKDSMKLGKAKTRQTEPAATPEPTALAVPDDGGGQNMLALLTQANGYQAATASAELVSTPSNANQRASLSARASAAQSAASGWTPALPQQAVVLLTDKVQSISMVLNPPNLGPLEVVLKIENQVANVQFSASTPEVQQALRAGLPVLQDMLNQAGLTLGQADVGDHAERPAQRDTPDRRDKSRPSWSTSHGDRMSPGLSAQPSLLSQQPLHLSRRGLVNLYA